MRKFKVAYQADAKGEAIIVNEVNPIKEKSPSLY